jgi:hypothetical protein
MKTHNLTRNSLLLAAGLLLTAAASQAAYYKVSIDTSALNIPPTSLTGPFSVDFQLNSGDTLGNNTAIIGNFNFSGGGAGGFGTASGPGVTGNLGGTINLTDTDAFNEYFETFTSGGIFEFNLQLSQNADAGPTPDTFSFSILDGSLANITTDGIANSLFQVNFAADGFEVANLNLGSGTGAYSGITVAAIPEPSAALLGVVACGLGVLRRRRSA